MDMTEEIRISLKNLKTWLAIFCSMAVLVGVVANGLVNNYKVKSSSFNALPRQEFEQYKIQNGMDHQAIFTTIGKMETKLDALIISTSEMAGYLKKNKKDFD